MKLPSPALVVALIALFVALGGVAGAATTMITTQMIRDNAVTRGKIAMNSINSAKIEDGSIQSKDLAANIRGQRGVAGPKGDKGETGARGPAGADGERGATGAAGVSGATGATGATGTTGPAGANGTDGIDGKTILSGSSDPTSGTGNNGDFYINTSSNSLFGPKASGLWPGGTSLVGPSGATGAAGPSDIYWDSIEVESVDQGSTTLGTFSLPAGSWLIAATFWQGGGGTSQTATASLVRDSDASTLASKYYFSRAEHFYVHLMYGATFASTTDLTLKMTGSGSTSLVNRSVNVMAIKTGNLTTS